MCHRRWAGVLATLALTVLLPVQPASGHRGAWESHSTIGGGGWAQVKKMRGCERLDNRRAGFSKHRCKHRVHWDRLYRNLNAGDKWWLAATRSCESGNGADEHGGPHHGRYQYLLSTAWSAGYTVDPHRVYHHEDDVRTVRWRNRAGASQWPNCG